MERGTDWEHDAVRERWTEIEQRRRAARRLRSGAVLVLGGLALTLWSLPSTACVEQGPWVHNCTDVLPLVTRSVLLVGGPVATLSGLWLCWRAFRE
jgi:hypothetical protein